MSPEGKPIQVNTNALQAAAAQNAVGRFPYLTILDSIYLFKNCHCKKYDASIQLLNR